MSAMLRVLAVAHHVGEGVMSFVSRLAAANGFERVRQFCADTGLGFQSLVDGSYDELSKVSGLTGVPVEDLGAWTMKSDADGFSLRGQRLVQSSLLRSWTHACPACLIADIAKSTRLPDVAAYGRTVWQVASIRTCPIHGMALVEVGRGKGQTAHDFTAVVRPSLDDLESLRDAAALRKASAFESYMLSRLNGEAIQPSPFLDSLPFHAAGRVCEMLGGVALHGRKLQVGRLGDEDWHLAGTVGFDIAASGEVGIRELFTDLQRRFYLAPSPNSGPRAPFGTLHAWLHQTGNQPSYEPIREILRRHIQETAPVGPGDECLGVPVKARILHSVRSASLETGLHPKRLRKIIAAARLIGEDHLGRKDNEVTFDAVTAAPLLDDLATAIPLAGVGDYLGCGRVQARILLMNGLIRPLVDASTTDGRHSFSRRHLDAFVADLHAVAVPFDGTGDVCDIPSASKRLHCSAVEIVHLILGRELEWVGLRDGKPGYLAVLVRPTEVAPLVRGQALEGLTMLEARAEMKTSDRVVRGLIEIGALLTTKGVSPFSRVPVTVITQESFKVFRRDFVSLAEIISYLRWPPNDVITELSKSNIQPCYTNEQVGATFYRKNDRNIQHIIHKYKRSRERKRRSNLI